MVKRLCFVLCLVVMGVVCLGVVCVSAVDGNNSSSDVGFINISDFVDPIDPIVEPSFSNVDSGGVGLGRVSLEKTGFPLLILLFAVFSVFGLVFRRKI
jgi:hypothetical protein